MPIESPQSKNKLEILKFVIPALIPILYMQGYAYYCGTISPYELSDFLYPISVEQTFIYTFFFYARLITNLKLSIFFIFSLFIIIPTIGVIFSKLGEKPERPEGKFNKAITDFILNNRIAFLIPSAITVIFYIFMIVMVATSIPYNLGQNAVYKKLNDENYLNRVHTISLQKNNKQIIGNIVECSTNLVTIIDKNKKISTFPLSEVHSIVTNVKKQE